MVAPLVGPPINAPLVGPGGVVNYPWAQWFSQGLYQRIGAQAGIRASDVVNVPAGSVAATDIQTAINELDSEKLATTGTAADSAKLNGQAASYYAVDTAVFHLTGGTLADSANFTFGTTTGTKIGTNAAEKLAFWGKTAVVQPTALTATAAAAPAGGTGTAAGGWDTAAHRDTAITCINNLKTRLDELESRLSTIGILP